MGPDRSSVLRIESNPTEASGSGRMRGESNNLAVVVHRVAPWDAREKRIFFLNDGIGNSCWDSTGKTLEISIDLR